MERALKHKQSTGNTQEQVEEEEEAKWYMVFDIIRARELLRCKRSEVMRKKNNKKI